MQGWFGSELRGNGMWRWRMHWYHVMMMVCVGVDMGAVSEQRLPEFMKITARPETCQLYDWELID